MNDEVKSGNLDSEDVNRILDNLLLQGNGEEISFWVWDHMCSICSYRKKFLEIREELRKECPSL
jgi:hypothetical protein